MRELFSITEGARYEILALCDKRKAQVGADVIPAIIWIDCDLNEGSVQSQIGIGFYNAERRQELKTDIRVTDDGLEYVLAVSENDQNRFLDKTLDFYCGKFCLT